MLLLFCCCCIYIGAPLCPVYFVIIILCISYWLLLFYGVNVFYRYHSPSPPLSSLPFTISPGYFISFMTSSNTSLHLDLHPSTAHQQTPKHSEISPLHLQIPFPSPVCPLPQKILHGHFLSSCNPRMKELLDFRTNPTI